MKEIKRAKVIQKNDSPKVKVASDSPKKVYSERSRRVFVGLSGGVDSSVSAALLKEQGYDVTGVFIKVWQPDFLECRWKEERLDAMRVCAKLEIPFLTFDFEENYKREVVEYMIDGYKAGRTPNPDVMCNKQIKFGAFLNKALEMGADFIATGHYTRKIQNSPNDKLTGQAKFKILKGTDANKDQSYFLWTLNQKQLKHILFPIGDLEKSEVRKLAGKFELPTEKKKDSQGLCFIGKLDMKDFLKRFIKEKQGNVLNEKGEIIGHHIGAEFYTIGERHDFTITKKGSNDKPYYIISKNISKNTVTVSQKCATLGVTHLNDREKIKIRDVNWVSGEMPNLDTKYQARIRYRQKLQICRLEATSQIDAEINVIFDENQDTAAAGQSLVIYDGEECLGGGIIV